MRLIDADKLEAKCKEIIAQEREYGTATVSWAQAFETFLDMLETAPTIEPQRWIPASEPPKSQKAVLVSAKDKRFGYRHTLRAAHIGHHEVTTEDYGWQEYECDTEYDEEKDCFWISECWYESNVMEDNTNWIIDSDYEVTHWMQLPEGPKEEICE